MGIWGKVIGACFGFMLAGPLGILLGIFVGNLFDKGMAGPSFFTGRNQHYVQFTYFRTTFQVMGHVAKSDGRVSEDEIRVARSIMQRMNLNQDQTMQAIRFFNEGKQADFNLHDALTDLIQACHNQRMLLQMFVEIQFQAAEADGVESPVKQNILETICAQLGFSPLFARFRQGFHQRAHGHSQGQRRQQQTQWRSSIEDDYDLLEVNKDASNADIKRAYRKLMSQNHPDKLIAQGLPEEMIKLANEKTQRISAAYDRIKSARGL